MKLIGFYEQKNSLLDELVEGVENGKIVHVAILFKDFEHEFVFESLPFEGVKIIDANKRLYGRGLKYKEVFIGVESPRIIKEMYSMYGLKYSWLSDFLAPFRIRLNRKNHFNCVEAVNKVIGTNNFYPKEFFIN